MLSANLGNYVFWFRVLRAWAGLLAQGGYIIFHCRSGGVQSASLEVQALGFRVPLPRVGLLAQGGYIIFHSRSGGVLSANLGVYDLGRNALMSDFPAL